jgi:hypothetical protein
MITAQELNMRKRQLQFVFRQGHDWLQCGMRLPAPKFWTTNGTPRGRAGTLASIQCWIGDNLTQWSEDTVLPMSWRWGRACWKAHRWAKIREKLRESGA